VKRGNQGWWISRVCKRRSVDKLFDTADFDTM